MTALSTGPTCAEACHIQSESHCGDRGAVLGPTALQQPNVGHGFCVGEPALEVTRAPGPTDTVPHPDPRNARAWGSRILVRIHFFGSRRRQGSQRAVNVPRTHR